MKNRILVVDDDPTLLKFLVEYFVSQSYEVESAANGQEGLRRAYNFHPHLIILDVMMPGMDGWDLAYRIREMAEIPIILLTAKSTEADKLHGFRLGVDDYVTKPFSFAELGARVQAILARTQKSTSSTAANILQFGEIILDLDKREARRGSEIIPLTPTEYRLLEHLARNQGKVISEPELIRAIWGDVNDVETTAIRRYIWLLRQKIETDPSQPEWIITVRGFGYRLGTGSLLN